MQYKEAERLWRGAPGMAYYGSDSEYPILEVTVDEYEYTSIVTVMPDDDFTSEFEVKFGPSAGACGGVMSNAVYYDGKRVGYAEGKNDEEWFLSLAELLMKL